MDWLDLSHPNSLPQTPAFDALTSCSRRSVILTLEIGIESKIDVPKINYCTDIREIAGGPPWIAIRTSLPHERYCSLWGMYAFRPRS
jgi:hypothetical protein